jgi:hypothetical protein
MDDYHEFGQTLEVKIKNGDYIGCLIMFVSP